MPEEEMSGKERFYRNNISDMLAEIKEAESNGKSFKRYNLRSEHFMFYETYFDARKLFRGGATRVSLSRQVAAICSKEHRTIKPEIYERKFRHKINNNSQAKLSQIL